MDKMNEKSIDRLINILYSLCAIAVIIGAFIKLQHYPYGSQLFLTGIILGTLVSYVDNMRLRKKIKKLEVKNIVE